MQEKTLKVWPRYIAQSFKFLLKHSHLSQFCLSRIWRLEEKNPLGPAIFMGKCVIYMSIKNLVMFQDHLNFRVIKSKKQAYIIEETKNIYSK